MADKKSRSNSIAPNAKGDLVVGTGSAASAVLGIGSTGQVLTADSTQTTGVKWASAGTTWTNRLNIGAANTFTQIAYNGSNLYVAVASGGVLYTSPDGATWTSRTSGFGSNDIYNVAYGNGLWVAVGANGTITTSTDGTTWTARTANMSTNVIYDVTYANSLWVAVGDGGGTNNTGGITYSSDGTTWTRKSQSLSVGAGYNCVLWNGTNWIVGADISSNNYLYASAPSGTWTAASTGNAATVRSVFWDGTRSIVTYSNGVVTVGNSATVLNVAQTWGNITVGDYRGERTTKLYNGTLHYLYSILQTLIPVTTAYPVTSAPMLVPTTTVTNSGVVAGNIGCLFVGAAGYIIGDNQGHIWTSF